MSLTAITQDRMTAIIKKHGAFFAFSQKQYSEKAIDGVEYVSVGAGSIVPKANAKQYTKDMTALVEAGIQEDLATNGKEAIIQRELWNHECGYTGDCEEVIILMEDYGITREEVVEVYRNTDFEL